MTKAPDTLCPLCGEVLASVEELALHRRSSHPSIEGGPFLDCSYCSERFDSEEQLDAHNRETHRAGQAQP